MLKVKPKRGINVNHRTPNWEIIHILRNCNRYWNWKPLKWTISASKLLWTQSQQIFQHHLYLTELSKPKESCEASRTKTMWSDGRNSDQGTIILPDIRTELPSGWRHPSSWVVNTFTHFPTWHIFHDSCLFLKILLPFFHKSDEQGRRNQNCSCKMKLVTVQDC